MPQAEEGQQYYVNDELFPTMVCLGAKWPVAVGLCSTLHSPSKTRQNGDIFQAERKYHKNGFCKNVYKAAECLKGATQTVYLHKPNHRLIKITCTKIINITEVLYKGCSLEKGGFLKSLVKAYLHSSYFRDGTWSSNKSVLHTD